MMSRKIPFSPSSRAFYCRMICQYASPGIQYLHAVLQRHGAVFLSDAAAIFFFFFSPFPPPSLFPLNRLERLFVMFLSGFGVRAASCCEVSIYRGIVQQCEPTATARVGLLKDR